MFFHDLGSFEDTVFVFYVFVTIHPFGIVVKLMSGLSDYFSTCRLLYSERTVLCLFATGMSYMFYGGGF